MTIGEHLLQVADAGLAVSDVDVDEDIYTHLAVLLAIEDALDQGRISLALTGSGTECKDEINTKMDELRTKIRRLISQCNEEEFLKFIDSRSSRLKSQFSADL
jgi:hypothetical protein